MLQEQRATAVVNRVKRAQGQLAGVLRMIEEGRDVDAVLHQVKAVSAAIDRVGFALVAQEWSKHVDDDSVGTDELARLEKLVLGLS
ncbi:MAG: cytoplasmic protein [Nocardioides sp.]|nr:cytoplasmic protein [Nocardioides sp.]